MNGDFEEKYFCSANSGAGFISYYPALSASAERVFVLKGGPGTGKSRFLREVGNRAERHGKRVVYYYCSSDADSLDAVVIDGNIVLLDGTAPHTAEASLPGARDDLIDLGAFWDSALLIGQRKRIARLSADKAACFSRAYKYLSAAASATEAADTMILPAVLNEKLEAAAARSLRSVSDGNAFSKTDIFLDSFGMLGHNRFETFHKSASEYITVSDFCGTAHIFFNALFEYAKKKRLAVTVSHSPIIPSRIDAIHFIESGRVYETGNGGEKSVNMKRFVDLFLIKPHRAELKLAYAMRDAAIEGALTAFHGAAEHHFGLEKIYGAAMEFAAKEEFTDNFIGEMFD